VGMAVYLRESLQSPKWLIPKVAQPQVPPSKKSETYYVRFCVSSHNETGNRREKKESGDKGMVM